MDHVVYCSHLNDITLSNFPYVSRRIPIIDTFLRLSWIQDSPFHFPLFLWECVCERQITDTYHKIVLPAMYPTSIAPSARCLLYSPLSSKWLLANWGLELFQVTCLVENTEKEKWPMCFLRRDSIQKKQQKLKNTDITAVAFLPIFAYKCVCIAR